MRERIQKGRGNSKEVQQPCRRIRVYVKITLHKIIQYKYCRRKLECYNFNLIYDLKFHEIWSNRFTATVDIQFGVVHFVQPP